MKSRTGCKEFLEKLRSLGVEDRFDLSLVESQYVDYTTEIVIRCKEHNTDFKIKPVSFINNLRRGRKSGCEICQKGGLGENTPTVDGRPDWNRIFEYKEGEIFWKIKPNNRTEVGSKAGTYKNNSGYPLVCVNQRHYLVHIVVWEIHNGPVPKGMQIDHIDHNRENYRLDNLRLVDNKENHHNMSLRGNNKTGVPGVSCNYVTKTGDYRFRATIRVNYELIELGYYDDWFEAVCARKSAQNFYCFHENCGRRS